MARPKKAPTEYQQAISKIAADTGIPVEGVQLVIRNWFRTIAIALKKGFPVNIYGLGRFKFNQKRTNSNLRAKRIKFKEYNEKLRQRKLKYYKKMKNIQ